MTSNVQVPQSVLDYLKTLAFRSDPNLRPEGSVIEYTNKINIRMK
jgi:hypothetical protein